MAFAEDITDELTDIVLPPGGTPFPPYRGGPPQTPTLNDGWAFADSFELAMLATALAGAAVLAFLILTVQPSTPLASFAHAVLEGVAFVSGLAALWFTVEGLLRLRSLSREPTSD